jgi:tRNA threonylcarbamoyl adenosine modification protein YeaZ
MKILALEFSSPIRSAAVAVDGNVCRQVSEQGGRETHAFALIDSALQRAGVARQEIECIAVGLGPGSYAGIRIAIAIAQGWQLAQGIKLLGISSAEVVAAQAARLGSPEVRVGLDAQRHELYAARYDVSIPGRPKLVEAFRPLSATERFEEGSRILRMDLSPQEGIQKECAFPPDAEFLAGLAANRADFVPGHHLEPIYVRKAEFVKAPPPRFGAI